VDTLHGTEAAQARCLAAIPATARLQTIPGWGPVITATVLGELGDGARFHDPREPLKLAGLNLTDVSSGQHRGWTRISKRGRPGSRFALYQAAPVVVATDPGWGPVRRLAAPLRQFVGPEGGPGGRRDETPTGRPGVCPARKGPRGLRRLSGRRVGGGMRRRDRPSLGRGKPHTSFWAARSGVTPHTRPAPSSGGG